MEENKIKPPKLPNQKAIKAPKEKKVEEKVLTGQSVKEKNPVLVTSSKTKNTLLIIALFLVALIMASVLFVAVLPHTKPQVDISVEFKVDSQIQIDEEYVTGEKKLLPGDTFKGTYSVRTSADEDNSNAEVYVRVAVFAEIDNKYVKNVFQIKPNDNWILGADGFYYMYGTLKANEMVEIVSDMVLNKDLDNSFQGKQVKIVFVGECLQAGEDGFSAIQSVWKEAPTQWKNTQKEYKG